jgi:hypothetical protein
MVVRVGGGGEGVIPGDGWRREERARFKAF